MKKKLILGFATLAILMALVACNTGGSDGSDGGRTVYGVVDGQTGGALERSPFSFTVPGEGRAATSDSSTVPVEGKLDNGSFLITLKGSFNRNNNEFTLLGRAKFGDIEIDISLTGDAEAEKDIVEKGDVVIVIQQEGKETQKFQTVIEAPKEDDQIDEGREKAPDLPSEWWEGVWKIDFGEFEGMDDPGFTYVFTKNFVSMKISPELKKEMKTNAEEIEKYLADLNSVLTGDAAASWGVLGAERAKNLEDIFFGILPKLGISPDGGLTGIRERLLQGIGMDMDAYGYLIKEVQFEGMQETHGQETHGEQGTHGEEVEEPMIYEYKEDPTDHHDLYYALLDIWNEHALVSYEIEMIGPYSGNADDIPDFNMDMDMDVVDVDVAANEREVRITLEESSGSFTRFLIRREGTATEDSIEILPLIEEGEEGKREETSDVLAIANLNTPEKGYALALVRVQ